MAAIAKTEGSRASAIEALTDTKAKDYASIAYLDDGEKEEKLFENHPASYCNIFEIHQSLIFD